MIGLEMGLGGKGGGAVGRAKTNASARGGSDVSYIDSHKLLTHREVPKSNGRHISTKPECTV